ncbi:MAG: 1-phosphofructokinase [Deferribacteres bacterium]|nr:1-phosphofructokinase [Deferribacteres bacterium]
MIATVTLNPSLDHNIEVEELKIDDVTRMLNSKLDPGGKGINVSRIINTLGGPTVAYGFIAGKEGGQLSLFLAEEGILNSFIAVEGRTRINVIITERKTGKQTRINAEGPRVEIEDLERLKERITRLGGGICSVSFMVFAGSLPPGLPKTTYRDLIEEIKELGIKVVLDTDGEPLKQGVKAKPFMIKPNTYELQRLVDREIKTESDVLDAAERLLSDGIELVAVTRGGKSAFLVTKDFIYRCQPPKIKVISAVGSGDAFIGAFLLALYRGHGYPEAFKWGIAAGAATALVPGTGLMRKEDFEELLKEVEIEKIR